MVDRPAWLSAMEHGVLGEARARAFLLDRFWVLDRSVDVEGADLLIQLRDTRLGVFDSSSPRVGLVQVKYIQDGHTSITIPATHVRDDSGESHKEFFLIVCTGSEDSERLFLLSASDICAGFVENDESGKATFRFTGSKLLSSSNFEVKAKSVALDRIEHTLRGGTMVGNRRYLRQLGAAGLSADQIDADYVLPVFNWWGDIRSAFYRQKVDARKILYEVEEVADALDELIRTTDPAKAQAVYNERLRGSINGHGDLRFAAAGILDEDLIEVARQQKALLQRVRQAGIEGDYFNVLHRFDSEALKYARQDHRDDMRAVHGTITYSPDDLSEVSVVFSSESERCVGSLGEDGYAVVVESTPGRHVLCYDARHALARSEWNDPSTDPSRLRLPFQRTLDEQLLGPMPDETYL
jgi:hypothetical protein